MEKIFKPTILLLLFICIIVFFPNFNTNQLAFSHIHKASVPEHSDLSNHLEHSISISVEKIFPFSEAKENYNNPFYCHNLPYLFNENFTDKFANYFWHPPKHI